MYRTNIIKLAVTICSLWLLSGCSVYMASNQPDKKDLSVLNIGTERSALVAEIGEPETTDIVAGKKIETYRFTQGYSSGAKTSRAIGHGVADILSLGAWELIGTTTEVIADGTEMIFEVVYSTDDRVENVRPLGEFNLKPSEVQNASLKNQRVRQKDITIACELCGDPTLSEKFQDIPNGSGLADIPQGYAVVVGTAYMTSQDALAINQEKIIDDTEYHYPAAVILSDKDDENKRFMIAGPNVHVYLVPAGVYHASKVSSIDYGALFYEFKKDPEASEFTNNIIGFMNGFRKIGGKVSDTAYAPIRGTARMADKALGGGDPQATAEDNLSATTLNLRSGDVVYIGHLQIYHFEKSHLVADVEIHNEFAQAKDNLSKLYPELAASLQARPLGTKQKASLE